MRLQQAELSHLAQMANSLPTVSAGDPGDFSEDFVDRPLFTDWSDLNPFDQQTIDRRHTRGANFSPRLLSRQSVRHDTLPVNRFRRSDEWAWRFPTAWNTWEFPTSGKGTARREK